MRSICFERNKVLPEYIPRETIEAAGRQLGPWKHGTLVFDSQDQACVLIDHAIHGCFKDGENAVDRYVAARPPKPGSDEDPLHRDAAAHVQGQPGTGTAGSEAVAARGTLAAADIRSSSTPAS